MATSVPTTSRLRPPALSAAATAAAREASMLLTPSQLLSTEESAVNSGARASSGSGVPAAQTRRRRGDNLSEATAGGEVMAASVARDSEVSMPAAPSAPTSSKGVAHDRAGGDGSGGGRGVKSNDNGAHGSGGGRATAEVSPPPIQSVVGASRPRKQTDSQAAGKGAQAVGAGRNSRTDTGRKISPPQVARVGMAAEGGQHRTSPGQTGAGGRRSAPGPTPSAATSGTRAGGAGGDGAARGLNEKIVPVAGRGGGTVPDSARNVAVTAAGTGNTEHGVSVRGAGMHGGGEDGEQEQQQQATLMDKRALQMTLLSLMEDDRFVDMLHARYVAVMKRRSSR